MDSELLTEYVSDGPVEIPIFVVAYEKLHDEFRRRWEGSSKIWKRFAPLPNVEGQKYTIGEIFTSREEQGEFIFLSKEQLTKLDKKGDPLVEIHCLRQEFWVTPKGGNGVFINGKRIKTRSKLVFGDYLSFEEKMPLSREEGDEVGPEIVRFWFKKREMIPEAFFSQNTHFDVQDTKLTAEKSSRIKAIKGKAEKKASMRNQSVFMACQNDLIVSHILSYLTVPELRSVGLVSKLWNRERNKALRERAWLVADRDISFLHSIATRPMYFFQYVQDMKNMRLRNWKILIPTFKNGIIADNNAKRVDLEPSDPSYGTPGAKWISDFSWFLGTHSHVVKRLKLKGGLLTQLELDQWIKILDQLSPNLEELELTVFYFCIEDSTILNFPNTLKFPKLRRFNLFFAPTVSDCNVADLYNFLTPLFVPIIGSVLGVKSLKLDCDLPTAGGFLQSLNWFHNLEQLSLKKTFPEAMWWILTLEKPLKKLDLGELDGLVNETVYLFEHLLFKHSQSLETLYFYPFTNGEVESVTIKFPSFPKLKHLKIGRPAKMYDQCAVIPMTFKFGSAEDDGLIRYDRDFPLLQSLTLHPYDVNDCDGQTTGVVEFWEKHSDTFNSFFPPEKNDEQGAPKPLQICKSLVILNIPAFREPSGPLLFPRAEELSKMFPNVFNVWTNVARMIVPHRIKPRTRVPKPRVVPGTAMVLRSNARRFRPRKATSYPESSG